jgi:2-amino-4-hydroxy-6-hydroxymethyldihydropteridine diphosphokinase
MSPLREQWAFLGLGSNIEDRFAHLQHAVNLLDADERTRVDAVSSVYETAPVGGPPQPDYCNIAVRVATRRSPRRLLELCAEIESALGRVRAEHWGPRTIDVDILLYGERTVSTRRLQIPHPSLAERAFALVPLLEVAPGATLPDGTSLATLLSRLAPIEDVVMVGQQVTAP